MRPIFALILALPLLGGCVDQLAARQAELAPLVGRSEADLVRQLGVPSRSFEAEGHRFLAYSERRVDIVPGFAPFYGPPGFYGGVYAGSFAFGPEVVERGCETTFEIVEGKVASFSLRGNACG
jgi:hypothetical protein